MKVYKNTYNLTFIEFPFERGLFIVEFGWEWVCEGRENLSDFEWWWTHTKTWRGWKLNEQANCSFWAVYTYVSSCSKYKVYTYMRAYWSNVCHIQPSNRISGLIKHICWPEKRSRRRIHATNNKSRIRARNERRRRWRRREGREWSGKNVTNMHMND